MKSILSILAVLLASTLLRGSLPAPVALTVTVTTNGQIVSPTNLFVANSNAIVAVASGATVVFDTNAFARSGLNVSLAPTLHLTNDWTIDGGLLRGLELGDITQLTLDGVTTDVSGVQTLFLDGGITYLRGLTNLNILTPAVTAGTATNGQVLRLTDAVEGTVEFGDSSDTTKLPLAGGTMSGDINLGLRWITNAAGAVRATDLANRRYVDAEIAAGATMAQPLAAPIATLTSGLSIADPNSTNPPIWLDYQILAALTGTDTNAPTAVGTPSVWYDVSLMSGASVSSLTDFSGNGRHATNATVGQQPTIVTNGLASKNTLRFTRASSQVLATPTFTALPQPNTIFIVGKFANTTSQNEVILDGGTQNNRIYAANAGLSGKIGRISAATIPYDTHFLDASWHVYEAHFNGDNTEFSQDGGTKYTMRTVSASGGIDQVWLGGIVSNTGGFNFDGEIAEVLIYDKGLSRAERNRVRQYLGRKWAIPAVQYVDGGVVSGVFRYASTIDSPNNLLAAYAYPVGRANLPIVVHMHGFAGSVGTMMARNWVRQAQQGAFVIVPSLRSADGTQGTPDWSGREIHDIWDAVNQVRTTFEGVVHTNLVAIAGYSGGGGNALNYAVKFPDSAAVIASHFGISDYGYNTTWGWYQTTATVGQKSSLDTYLGTPVAAPDSYRSRSSVEALATNYTGGWTYLFHDQDDTSVSINQSYAVVTNLVAAGRSNFTTNFTTSALPSSQRFLHQNPNDGSGAAASESIWLANLVTGVHNPWVIPESGTLRVNGYVVTKRFRVWLGGGTNEVANLTYNAASRTYTVTPLTAPLDFTVTQGSGSITRTNISAATTVTVP